MKGSRKETVGVGQLLSSPTSFRRMRSPVFISRLNAVFRFVNISFVGSSLIPHPRFKYLHLVPSIVLARRPSFHFARRRR
jgi:hypothetical protein